MQPINIYNSPDVKVTIDENGTPVDVYVSGGSALSLEFYSTYSALPAQGQGGILYITEDTNYIYRWDGGYIQVGGGATVWGQISGTLSDQTDLQNALDDKVPYSGATNNIDIGDHQITANDGTNDSAFASSFIGVENSSGYSVIDPTGLYVVDSNTQMQVNADGLVFPDNSVQTTAGISGVDWGDIQGTLSNQSDLQTALDGKVDENSAITGDTKTKITYDSKGLVTSGADAGISDITGLQTALDAKVPYTGATGNVTLGEYGLTGGYYQFDTTPTTYTQAVGNVGWNDTDGTIEMLLKGGNVVLEIGQKLVARVINGSGGNVLKSNYQVVKVTGAQGQRLQVNLAQANNDANSADTLGLIAENISNNQSGFIVTSGIIDEVNTTGSLQSETWADGDPLYLSPTTAGKITNVKPQAPSHTVIIGFVVYAHANHGKIFVKIDNGYELDELHNVKINTPLNGQVLRYNGTLFVWENSNDSDNLTFNAPLSRATNTISITQSSASADGYLSSTDWNTFNSKQNALTNPVTGTGTSNELAYFTGTSAIASLSTSTYPSLTELSYVKGVTSSIQTQLNGKQATLTNPVTGTGTSGQVAYWNGTTSQTGSSNLFWDATNSRLGIGTSSPSYILDLVNNINDNALIRISNSTVGLNANTGFNITTSTGQVGLGKYSSSTNPNNMISANDGYITNGSVGDFNILNSVASSKVKIRATTTGKIISINQNGLGINSDTATDNNLLSYTNTTGPNAIHGRFENASQSGRTQLVITSGAYPENFFSLMTHGTSYTNNYYATTRGATTDAGKGILLLQGTSVNEFIVGTYNSQNLGFFTANTTRQTIFANGNVAIGTTTDSGYKLDVNGTARVQGDFTISDAKNIILASTTGTKIGTATSQKLSFWNATPIVQPTTGVAAATRVGGAGNTVTDSDTFGGYTIAQLVTCLKNVGLIA